MKKQLIHLLVGCLIFPAFFRRNPGVAAHPTEHTEDLIDLQARFPQVAHDQGPTGDVGAYVCVTMDWWPDTKCAFGHCRPWTNSSVLTANLTSTKLVALLRAFDGITLRIGGTLADSIVYQEDEIHDPLCQPFTQESTTTRHGFDHGCLTRERWRQVTHFAANASARIIFGLNALYGRNGNIDAPWDSSNTRSFLEVLKEENLIPQIDGFELGNELYHFYQMKASVHAQAFQELDQLLRDVFGDEERSRLKLLGPDVTSWKLEAFMTEFVQRTKHFLDGLTWHSYPLGPPYQNTSKPLHTQMMRADKMATLGEKPAKHIARDAPHMQLIMGESGGVYDSGQDGLSNRFIDSFWYLKSMATLAQNRHQMFCRQSLLGGFYELVNHTSHAPNPSYYAALLFSKVMVRKVWQTNLEGQNATSGEQRIYAHCNMKQSRLGILVLNFSSNTTAQITELNGMLPNDLVPRDDYVVTASSLYDDSILLNGEPLLPPMEGQEEKVDLIPSVVIKANQHITIPPQSYAFVFFNRRSRVSKVICGGS